MDSQKLLEAIQKTADVIRLSEEKLKQLQELLNSLGSEYRKLLERENG